MRILRSVPMALFSLVILCMACSSGKPLTPEEAFTQLRQAYTSENAEKLYSLLSTGSRAKISGIVESIQSMPAGRQKAMAEKMGVAPSLFDSISPTDYLALQVSVGKTKGDDPIREALRHEITGITVKNKVAVVKVQNGMELFFHKEGPYWMFVYE
ncbi:MAG TPA: hypothetical protein VKQ10_06675 [Spirochaetota bacterium]|nr:hypothetical protein [Spirochaetota bacterium]